MLKLVKITKDYILKEQEPVHALKGLSVNFRRNEFVAILGPSGCGKTTLLNIIGGLDRYTTGDLLIGGISTKDYKDRDWDTYRNHSIGFVFQSYNLIGHQNILRNVELALTIGGISKKERKERAIEALAKVGLAGLEKKKPNQLSGGQMQRVAIARALVNNPEIILADEPTGALDSETSIQVMDLLKEVAKNCLVIMVTHNPDLADKYANRIVKMKDGELLSDSNPFSDDAEIKEVNRIEKVKEKALEAKPDKKRKEKKSAMSFFTATGLSLSNLISKLSRTILIAIAGSIGIVGVSSVLAVSFGVKNYVNNMQDDMLSEYPITISEESVSLSSLMSGLNNWSSKDIPSFDEKTSVGLNSLIQYLMKRYASLADQMKTNDITKEFLAYIEQLDENSINSLKYDYGIDPTNNIFTDYTRDHTVPEDQQDKYVTSLNGLTHMYASELHSVEGFSMFSSYISLFTNFMKQLPNSTEFIESQYDVLAGTAKATKENELILVVDEDQAITDMLYGQLGYLDETEFMNIAFKALQDNDSSIKEEDKIDYSEKYRDSFTFKEIMDKNFYYYPDIYSWDKKEYKSVRFDMQIEPSIAALIASGNLPGVPAEFAALKISYDFIYKEDIDVLMAENSGLSMTLVRESEKPDESVSNKIYGTWVPKENLFDLIASAYGIDDDGSMDMFKDITIKYVIEPNKASVIFYDSITGQEADLLNQMFVTSEPKFYKKTCEGYMYDVNPEDSSHSYGNREEMKIVGILKKKKNLNFGSLATGIYYTPAFTAKYMADQLLTDIVSKKSAEQQGILAYMNSANKSDIYRAYLNYKYTYHYNEDGQEKSKVTSDIAYSLNGSASSSISSFISIAGFGSDNNVNKAYIRSLCGLATKTVDKTNVFEDVPQSISIYPKSFKDKDKVTSHLDKWNSNVSLKVTINGQETTLNSDSEVRTEITYNDPVEMIISLINTLIIVVTGALIAFTSLSLVVSCFMIAVITFISTMERVKEIGVIRSLGGRKKDVSRLFIAECLITGLASGLIGIGVTYILQLIFNIVMLRWNIFGMAALPIWMAAIMILLSITLNVLSGLIPSMKASNQDPVIALRSE